MFNILKADLNKFIKGKVFKWMIGLTIIFPFFEALMYKYTLSVSESVGMEDLSSLINTKSIFLQSFNPLQNYGLITLILVLVIITADFTQNTIRNKIISGYSKDKIYLSSAIFTKIIVVSFVTTYVILNYLFTGYVLGFSTDTFFVFFKEYLLLMTSLLVIYAFIQMVAFAIKSFGGTLGITLGALFLLMIIFSAVTFSLGLKGKSLEVIVTIFSFLNVMLQPDFESLKIWLVIIVNIIYIGGFTFLGLTINKKLDYK